jgi:hypothetical protein
VREELLRMYLLKMNLPFPRRPYPWSGASKVSFKAALNVVEANALPLLAQRITQGQYRASAPGSTKGVALVARKRVRQGRTA